MTNLLTSQNNKRKNSLPTAIGRLSNLKNSPLMVISNRRSQMMGLPIMINQRINQMSNRLRKPISRNNKRITSPLKINSNR